jgi:hypothetical protein
LNHHVANVNSNPKLKAAFYRRILGGLYEGFLHGNGTLDGINGTRGLGQDTIACRVCDPASVFRN